MTFRLSVLRGMSRFQCTGSRCEDTCCSGLRITVTPEWLARVSGVIGKERAAACARPSEDLTVMALQEDGTCTFLAKDRLCSLHRDHGPSALPEVCAQFPRVMWRYGAQVEQTGSLGCPEVVRQLLVAEDGLEEVVTEVEDLSSLTTGEGTADLRIREAFLALSALTRFPFSSRLAFLAQLASALDALHTPGEGANLEELLARFHTPEVLESLHHQQAALCQQLPREPTLGTYLSLLRAQLPLQPRPRFQRIAGNLPGRGELTPDNLSRMAEEFRASEAWLLAAPGSRLQRIFDNALRFHFLRHPPEASTGLLPYLFRLTFRMGLVRTLFLGQPAVARRAEEPEQVEALVECFQLVARQLVPLEHQAQPEAQKLLGSTLVLAAY